MRLMVSGEWYLNLTTPNAIQDILRPALRRPCLSSQHRE